VYDDAATFRRWSVREVAIRKLFRAAEVRCLTVKRFAPSSALLQTLRACVALLR
jgi:hypothetical protein